MKSNPPIKGRSPGFSGKESLNLSHPRDVLFQEMASDGLIVSNIPLSMVTNATGKSEIK